MRSTSPLCMPTAPALAPPFRFPSSASLFTSFSSWSSSSVLASSTQGTLQDTMASLLFPASWPGSPLGLPNTRQDPPPPSSTVPSAGLLTPTTARTALGTTPPLSTTHFKQRVFLFTPSLTVARAWMTVLGTIVPSAVGASPRHGDEDGGGRVAASRMAQRHAFETGTVYGNQSGVSQRMSLHACCFPSFDGRCTKGDEEWRNGAAVAPHAITTDADRTWVDCGLPVQWIPSSYSVEMVKQLMSSFTDETSLLVVCPEKHICLCLPMQRQHEQPRKQYIFLSSQAIQSSASSFSCNDPSGCRLRSAHPTPIESAPSQRGAAPDMAGKEGEEEKKGSTVAEGGGHSTRSTTHQRLSAVSSPLLSPSLSTTLFSYKVVAPHPVKPSPLIRDVLAEVMASSAFFLRALAPEEEEETNAAKRSVYTKKGTSGSLDGGRDGKDAAAEEESEIDDGSGLEEEEEEDTDESVMSSASTSYGSASEEEENAEEDPVGARRPKSGRAVGEDTRDRRRLQHTRFSSSSSSPLPSFASLFSQTLQRHVTLERLKEEWAVSAQWCQGLHHATRKKGDEEEAVETPEETPIPSTSPRVVPNGRARTAARRPSRSASLSLSPSPSPSLPPPGQEKALERCRKEGQRTRKRNEGADETAPRTAHQHTSLSSCRTLGSSSSRHTMRSSSDAYLPSVWKQFAHFFFLSSHLRGDRLSSQRRSGSSSQLPTRRNESHARQQ